MTASKTCTKCGTQKSLFDFHKRASANDGHSYMCKSCRSAQDKAHFARERERIVERQKKYNDANRERINENQKERNRVHYQNNKAQYRARLSVRHKVERKAKPSWADSKAMAGFYELAQLFKRAGLNLHVDHIVPLQGKNVCGLHWEGNMQLLLASKNVSKGNKLLEA